MAKRFIQRSLPRSRKHDYENADYLRVIGAGLPRTGTSSLKSALEILGFGPCHHMTELFDKSDRSILFSRAFDGDMVDFESLMKGYGSTVDCPTSDFYKEIHQMYPKAKIILSVRENGNKWFDSFHNTIETVLKDDWYYYSIYLIEFLRLQCIVCRKMWKKWKTEYESIGPEFHDQYNARVVNENKDTDLLVFNVKEGWSPLCKFLQVEIPKDIPFPNINDGQMIKRNIKLMKIMGWCAWIFLIIIVILTIYFFLQLYYITESS